MSSNVKTVNRKTWDMACQRLISGEINFEKAAGLCDMTRTTFVKYYNRFIAPEEYGELPEGFFTEDETESKYAIPKGKRAEDLPIL